MGARWRVIVYVFALGLFVLCSCSTWRHVEGYGSERLRADKADCEEIARAEATKEISRVDYSLLRAGGGEGSAIRYTEKIFDEHEYEHQFNACMVMRGWRKR